MARYKETIIIPDAMAWRIQHYLEHEPKDEDECLGEDETICDGVKFQDGTQMDIKCCGVQYLDEPCRSNKAWTEAVLFDRNGSEIACTDVSDSYLGEWTLEHAGNTYTCIVKNEKAVQKEKFEQECYGAYQLDWMMSHGYSLKDLYGIMAGIASETIETDPLLIPEDGDAMGHLMEGCEEQFHDSGFGSGSLYVCKEKFLGAEFLDGDYMRHLLSSMPDPDKKISFWKQEYGKAVHISWNWPRSKFSMETTAGTLLAYESADPGQPGICVMLQPDGYEEEIDLAYISVYQDPEIRTPYNEGPKDVSIMVYGNVYSEDYTEKVMIRRSDIDQIDNLTPIGTRSNKEAKKTKLKSGTEERTVDGAEADSPDHQRITREMVAMAYNKGVVKVTDQAEMYGCPGTACVIGQNGFYLRDDRAEEMTAREYISNVPKEDIIDKIFHALDDDGGMRTEFEGEYDYYFTVIYDSMVKDYSDLYDIEAIRVLVDHAIAERYPYFDIVEDSQEYGNGLMVIGYSSLKAKRGEEDGEVGHYCIDLDDPESWK